MDTDSRRQANAGSRSVGVLALLGGLVAIGLTWRWALVQGHYEAKIAFIGPLALAVGIGFLVHGAEMPLNGITTRARIYGLIGSIAGIVNLYLLGYFKSGQPPIFDALLLVMMIGVWFIPDRFFGGTGHVPLNNADSDSEQVK